MNFILSDSPTVRGRAVRLVAGLIAVAGIAWAAATGTNSNPPVSVKVDTKPISATNSPLGPSYAPVVKRVAPSVVKVMVTERGHAVSLAGMPYLDDPQFRRFFGLQNGANQLQTPPQQGLGSGVVVSADGYILTNNHVVGGADSITVSLGDGREIGATVIGTDPLTDLAVIKVKASDLPAITFADSDKVEVGDRVLAIGNPFGIGQTVTSGMVSGLGRSTPFQRSEAYEDFIQTDAAINPGNSGGALVDGEGRLVGINTAIISESGGSQGIGFAIPANLARSVMEQLTTTGKVVRGFLGVTMQEVTPLLAKSFKLETRAGALISEVTPGSPAAKAGLKEGDVITAFSGKPVADTKHLQFAVASVAPDTKVPVEVVRDGKKQTLSVQVGERVDERTAARSLNTLRRGNQGKKAAPAPAPAATESGTLNGVAVDDIDARSRREFDIAANVRGALVVEVDPNSAAARSGLQPGDVILEINKQPVRGADDAVKLTENSDNKETVLRIWNQRGSRYVSVDESTP